MKRTSQTDKTALFETMPVPKAVLTLAVPTVASILVTLLYSLADTWFVGLLNDPERRRHAHRAGAARVQRRQ